MPFEHRGTVGAPLSGPRMTEAHRRMDVPDVPAAGKGSIDPRLAIAVQAPTSHAVDR